MLSLTGEVTEEDIEAFRQRCNLGRWVYNKARVARNNKVWKYTLISKLTITEGKFHQVKRMFEAVGKRVVYLKRISMGPLELDESLELGEYRELSEEEISELKNGNR